MAQNEGKKFEGDWKQSIPENVYYLRIIDPAISFGNYDNEQNDNVDDNIDDSHIRFSPSNPFDAIMYCYPNLFLLEQKSTKGTAYSFKGKSPMIKEKQIKELTRGSVHKGIIAGLLFNMRKYEKTYFMPIENFNKFLSETQKGSINQKDILTYGAIEVIGQIKKVRYKYYIGEFIEKIQNDQYEVS